MRPGPWPFEPQSYSSVATNSRLSSQTTNSRHRSRVTNSNVARRRGTLASGLGGGRVGHRRTFEWQPFAARDPLLSFRSPRSPDTMPANPGAITPRIRLMGRLSIVLALVVLFPACESAPPDAPVAPATRPDIYLAPDSKVSRGVVPRNSTLEEMLLEQGLQAEVVHGVIDAVKTVFDPRRLRSLQPFALEQSLDGALRLFEYEIDASSFLRVKPVPDGAEGSRRSRPDSHDRRTRPQ